MIQCYKQNKNVKNVLYVVKNYQTVYYYHVIMVVFVMIVL